MKNKLYLIPTTLGGETVNDIIPIDVQDKIKELRHFVVEDIKSARRFLRKIDRTFPIDESTFSILNKKTDPADIYKYLSPIKAGHDIGVLSEAGCPGVADPGASIVNLAHTKNIEVVPFVGPSSILLSLMASGFSGQNFTFHGYLPRERKDRVRTLKHYESETRRNGITNIFMDTPFRNMNVLDDLLNELSDTTEICIACNVTTFTQRIQTMTVKSWREIAFDLSKKPTIFIIGKSQDRS